MSLTTNFTFVGKGNWSIDGVSGQANGNDTISAIVPEGSTIQAAFLYGTTFGSSGDVNGVTLTIGAVSTAITDFTALGVTSSFPLQAFRADVTDFITATIGDGDDEVFNFVRSGIDGNSVDGFALVIVYANPDESVRTISLLDGFSQFAGDDFALSFAEPVDTTQAGFEAQLSLGIGFGFQPSDQFSVVTIDDRQLTTSAGAQDDGTDDFSPISNGGLITIGGIGDTTANPDPDQPINSIRTDDELYDLAQGNTDDATPFLANGATSIEVSTLNPSNNDNIFFAGFNITAVVAVDTDENDAPVAVGDEVSVDENATVSFNVLTNDFDPDAGDVITLSSVDTTGPVGTLTNNGDGTFSYDPDGEFDDLAEGETATTTFDYTVTDEEETATTTVVITVNGIGDDGPVDPLPVCPVIVRPGTIDGSDAANETLTGVGYHNSFYFDIAADSGEDTITNFQKVDVIVTNALLTDNNNDGIIGFGSNGILGLDHAGSASDQVAITGLTALRFMGESCEGVFVYADASVRRSGMTEGSLSDDMLAGDAGNITVQRFLYDTALDIDLGADTIMNFGGNDQFVTTSLLSDSDGDGIVTFGGNNLIDMTGGSGGPGDPGLSGEVGTVGMFGTDGAQILALAFLGEQVIQGVAYYSYGLPANEG